MFHLFHLKASKIPNFSKNFPLVRIPKNKRKFESKIIDKAIKYFEIGVKDEELFWLFNNCFPNTLDTKVTYSEKDEKPDTYVIAGDIDAMWFRGSSVQV